MKIGKSSLQNLKSNQTITAKQLLVLESSTLNNLIVLFWWEHEPLIISWPPTAQPNQLTGQARVCWLLTQVWDIKRVLQVGWASLQNTAARRLFSLYYCFNGWVNGLLRWKKEAIIVKHPRGSHNSILGTTHGTRNLISFRFCRNVWSCIDSDKSVERTTFSQPLHIDTQIFVLPQVGLEPPTLGFELITSKIGGECSTCIATKSSCWILRLTWSLLTKLTFIYDETPTHSTLLSILSYNNGPFSIGGREIKNT